MDNAKDDRPILDRVNGDESLTDSQRQERVVRYVQMELMAEALRIKHILKELKAPFTVEVVELHKD